MSNFARLVTLFFGLAVVGAAVGGPALAQETTAEQLKAAIDLYWKADLSGAEQSLRAILGQEGLSEDAQVLAHQYLAFSLVGLGREEEAEDEFVALLKLRPGYELDRTIAAARIMLVFRRAQKRVEEGPLPPSVVAPLPEAKERKTRALWALRAGYARSEIRNYGSANGSHITLERQTGRVLLSLGLSAFRPTWGHPSEDLVTFAVTVVSSRAFGSASRHVNRSPPFYYGLGYATTSGRWSDAEGLTAVIGYDFRRFGLQLRQTPLTGGDSETTNFGLGYHF